MSEEQKRTWAYGTDEAREALHEQLTLEGLGQETKAFQVEDILTLVNAQIARAQQAQEQAAAAPTADDVMMQVFLSSGLDPAVLDHWRTTAAEQRIPFPQFVMGHLVKAQQAGELNAPARDIGWVKGEAGSGGVMVQSMTYTCQNPACGKEEEGRLGQLYCSNGCAATHKRTIRAAEQQALVDQEVAGMRQGLQGLFSGQRITARELHQIKQLIQGNVRPPSAFVDDEVQREIAALTPEGQEGAVQAVTIEPPADAEPRRVVTIGQG